MQKETIKSQWLETFLSSEETIAYVEDYYYRRINYIENRIISKIPPTNTVLWKAISYFFSKKGKYFRPLLTLLSCEVISGQYENAIEAACAVELIHSSSLIFDDLPCMDNAEMRRGQVCLHRKYGEAVAILTAIYFLNKAYESVLFQKKEYGYRFLQVLTDCIGDNGMVVGQVMDLQGDYNNKMVRKLKTASLIKAAIQLGSYIGRATEKEENAMLKFAEQLGIVFQLRDDVMDGEQNLYVQKEAESIIYEAAKEICLTLGVSKATLTLASMGLYAVKRKL